MTRKGYLLATAASAAAVAAAGAGTAQAADLPLKAPPMVVPATASWAGWYIGGNVGADWAHSTNDFAASPYYGYSAPGSTAKTGFTGGGQIGYNWQQGNFVGGVEADISALTGTGTTPGYTNTTPYQITNRIDWLSTVRLRAGLAVGDTMLYTTGGLAIGGVKNTLSVAWYDNTYSQSQTRVGWTVGGGVEHMLHNTHWTVGLEGLFVDLGQSTLAVPGKTAKFSNEAIIGRVKLNYRF